MGVLEARLFDCLTTIQIPIFTGRACPIELKAHTCLAAAISFRAHSRLAFELLPGSPPWTPDTMQKPRCPPSAWHRSACFTIRSTSLQNKAHIVRSQDKVVVGPGYSTWMNE